MAALEMYADTYQALGYDLQAAIDSYAAALVEFATTEGLPAPSAMSLVEQIVKEHGGAFVIVPPPRPSESLPLPADKEFYRSPAEQTLLLAEEERQAKEEEEARKATLENKLRAMADAAQAAPQEAVTDGEL